MWVFGNKLANFLWKCVFCFEPHLIRPTWKDHFMRPTPGFGDSKNIRPTLKKIKRPLYKTHSLFWRFKKYTNPLKKIKRPLYKTRPLFWRFKKYTILSEVLFVWGSNDSNRLFTNRRTLNRSRAPNRGWFRVRRPHPSWRVNSDPVAVLQTARGWFGVRGVLQTTRGWFGVRRLCRNWRRLKSRKKEDFPRPPQVLQISFFFRGCQKIKNVAELGGVGGPREIQFRIPRRRGKDLIDDADLR